MAMDRAQAYSGRVNVGQGDMGFPDVCLWWFRGVKRRAAGDLCKSEVGVWVGLLGFGNLETGRGGGFGGLLG